MDEIPDLLARIAATVPPILERNGYPGPPWSCLGRCIVSTRVGIEVLKAFGVEAIAVPVSVSVANKVYLEAATKKLHPLEAQRLGAWLIEIDTESKNDNGYPGHLVVGIPSANMILDLDAGQFNRPAKNIHVPRATHLDVRSDWWTGAPLAYELPEGAVMLLQRLKTYESFEVSPDWYDRSRWTRTVRKSIKALGGNPNRS